MKALFDYLRQSNVMERLNQTLKHERKFELSDTLTPLSVFLLHAIYRMTNKNILVVANNLYHAQKMYDLLNAANNVTVDFFPQDEFITTDMLAMSEDLKFERLNTLKPLIKQNRTMVVTNPSGYLKPLWPLHRHKKAHQSYQIGDEVEITALKQTLVKLGYIHQAAVEKVGDFALRGSILDVYLPDYDDPLRIDFFDDEIDSIRFFDVKSQRSKQKVTHFELTPRVEFFYDDQDIQTIETTLDSIITDSNLDDDTIKRIKNDVTQLKEYDNQDQLSRYMSFTKEIPQSLSDMMGDPIVIRLDSEKIDTATTQLTRDLSEWKDANPNYASIGFHLLHDPDRMYHPQTIHMNTFKEKNFKGFTLPLRAKEGMTYEHDFHMLIKDLKKYEGTVTVLLNISEKSRIQPLMESLGEHVNIKLLGTFDAPFDKHINIKHATMPLSFEWFDASFVMLNDENIYKTQTTSKQKKKQRKIFKDAETVSSVDHLKKGDYIVHYDYGIGRFLGVETKEVGGKVNDYIIIGYRGDDKVFVPVENIHRIQRYVAHEGITPKINKLGGSEWAKTKRRVRKKAKNIAKQLVKLYAQREESQGFAFSKDNELMDAFEADFPYEETLDQQKAIEATKEDMEKDIPMDRLVCGDVGYGKTEVALRAAFKAVLDNKQVVYLAPTTILSRQHYQTFKARMDEHGIRVEILNRFIKPSIQKQIIKDTASGKVDVLIGTHRLLSKDVNYADLGLMIVDEEQRFGVEHKERIKALKLEVDVLSLSATPIPRTLQMAMTGVKQMSLIETPPKNRFPIQTYVLRRSMHVIKDAIEREMGRGGQVFYLHNRVETIQSLTRELSQMVPDARIAHAQGQMGRVELENVMQAFLDHEFDVLVSTTIIETGIDIPNANTLIVHDADRLGLSQLYQIRGRVGRSDRIAYSYLMYDKNKQLKDEAAKRLQAIKEFTELGSGYKIASRDLAIRGAGDLLGTEQSGDIDSVGIDLFMDILKEEIEKDKDNVPEVQSDDKKTIGFKMPSHRSIPASYIPDDDTKIDLHKRIVNMESSNDYILLKEEMRDRFGPIPESLDEYMASKLYENIAERVGVEKVHQTKTAMTFILSEAASKNIHGDLLFQKANEQSKHIELDFKRNRLYIRMPIHKVPDIPAKMVVPILEILE